MSARGKKLEFKKPVNESKLQKIILNSLEDLDLLGQWHFEHDFFLDTIACYCGNEKVTGHLHSIELHSIVAEFEAYAAEGTFQEPMFAGIKFRPPYASEEGQKESSARINKIYDTFSKQYKKYIK